MINQEVLIRKARTDNIGARAKECATKLCDSKLMAELELSDMHELDAQYHRNCLVVYNWACNADSKVKSCSSSSSEVSAEPLALAELVAYINKQSEKIQAPMFKLSDFANIYDAKLQQVSSDSESSSKANSTRLKVKLLELVPNLK